MPERVDKLVQLILLFFRTNKLTKKKNIFLFIFVFKQCVQYPFGFPTVAVFFFFCEGEGRGVLMKGRIVRRMEPMVSSELERDSGLVHANSFSNENGAVLLRFQKDLRPHLSFSYRFAPPHYNAASVLKMLLYSAHAQINSTHAHFNTSTREVGGKLKPHGSVCLQFGSKNISVFVWTVFVWKRISLDRASSNQLQ